LRSLQLQLSSQCVVIVRPASVTTYTDSTPLCIGSKIRRTSSRDGYRSGRYPDSRSQCTQLSLPRNYLAFYRPLADGHAAHPSHVGARAAYLGRMIKYRQPPTSTGLCGITCAPQLDMMPARRIAPTVSSPRLSPPTTRFFEVLQPVDGSRVPLWCLTSCLYLFP
jgi:hypothetical protein